MAGEEKDLPELDPVRDNATADDFKTKNKVYELILYTGPELEQFPRAKRRLAEKIDETMLEILRLVATLENKHYKKTTLGELDTEVDILRHLIRLADDKDMYPDKKAAYEQKTGEYTVMESWQGVSYGGEWKYRIGYFDLLLKSPGAYYVGPSITIYR